jgi:large subunit ribosomal protein L24
MKTKTHVKEKDNVVVISGNHKGKQGIVLSVNAAKEQVVVEGVRVMKKAIRRSEENQDGGIEEVECPIHISNIKKV